MLTSPFLTTQNKIIQQEKAQNIYGLNLPTHGTFAGGLESVKGEDTPGKTCTMAVRMGSYNGAAEKQMRMRLDEAGGSIKVRLYEESLKESVFCAFCAFAKRFVSRVTRVTLPFASFRGFTTYMASLHPLRPISPCDPRTKAHTSRNNYLMDRKRHKNPPSHTQRPSVISYERKRMAGDHIIKNDALLGELSHGC